MNTKAGENGCFEMSDDAVSPKSIDEHGSHEGGSMNTATSSPSSTPGNAPPNGTTMGVNAPTSSSNEANEMARAAKIASLPTGNLFQFGLQQKLMAGFGQMPIDFSNMFSFFEKMNSFSDSGLQFEGIVPRALPFQPFAHVQRTADQTVKVEASQMQNTSLTNEQAALAQLSQFINTHSKQMCENSPSMLMNSGGKMKSSASENRRSIRRQHLNQHSLEQFGSARGVQEKKRSYPYTFQYCVLCQKNVHSSKLPCHIRQCHVGKPMFECPECDFTSTYSKNNVKSHMVSLHGNAGDPISHMDGFAPQVEEFMKKCFPNVRGRGRPVHGRHSPRSPSNSSISNNNNTIKHHHHSTTTTPDYLNLVHQAPSNEPTGQKPRLQKHYNNGSKKAFPIKNEPTQDQNEFLASNSLHFNEMSAMSTMNPSRNMIANGDEVLSRENMRFPFAPPTLNPAFYFQQLNNLGSFANAKKVKLERKFSPEPFGAFNNSLDSAKNRSKQCPDDDHLNSNNLEKRSSSNNIQHDMEFEFLESDSKPRYLPQPFHMSVLPENELPNTVFQTFANSTDLIEKLDPTHFEELFDNSNESLLTSSQLKNISEVRKAIKLKDFEIMFAIHRLDLDILNRENVELVASIAPTNVDVRRFVTFEQTNSINGLSDDERFLIQLSKIERLNEKLTLMAFMGNFDSKASQINDQIETLMSAAKTLHNSTKFHTILHLLLTCANLIAGDFNVQLIQGFRSSRIGEMCMFKFPSNISLLDLLAERINECYPELSSFSDECEIVERASKTQFLSIAEELRTLERGRRFLETEFLANEQNQMLSNFLTHCELECTRLRETLNLAKEQLKTTLKFFGESLAQTDDLNFQPEKFFHSIARFSTDLSKALLGYSPS